MISPSPQGGKRMERAAFRTVLGGWKMKRTAKKKELAVVFCIIPFKLFLFRFCWAVGSRTCWLGPVPAGFRLHSVGHRSAGTMHMPSHRPNVLFPCMWINPFVMESLFFFTLQNKRVFLGKPVQKSFSPLTSTVFWNVPFTSTFQYFTWFYTCHPSPETQPDPTAFVGLGLATIFLSLKGGMRWGLPPTLPMVHGSLVQLPKNCRNRFDTLRAFFNQKNLQKIDF